MSCRGIEQAREARRRKIKLTASLENDPEKILEQSQLAVERTGLGKPRTIALSRI